jgi:hypothetical protein
MIRCIQYDRYPIIWNYRKLFAYVNRNIYPENSNILNNGFGFHLGFRILNNKVSKCLFVNNQKFFLEIVIII